MRHILLAHRLSSTVTIRVESFAPGRVNLIGDHTDYSGGLAMAMAIQMGTTVTGDSGGDRIELTSASQRSAVSIDLTRSPETWPSGDAPRRDWGRFVVGVVDEVRPRVGLRAEVTSTLPMGCGLSSSASLELALALALGFEGPPLALAELGRRAEQRAAGVPCGLMDQLVSASGVEGHALLLDFSGITVEPVPLPSSVSVVVIHSGESRALIDSAYGERTRQCEAVAAQLGPLPEVSITDLDAVRDPLLRRRVRHVITENERVRRFALALRSSRLDEAGRLMNESHRSLRDDFEVSTAALDRLVERLWATPGVHGARLTGAGFGGCAVALTEPGALDEGWTVIASSGARRVR
jgi:galactokinase